MSDFLRDLDPQHQAEQTYERIAAELALAAADIEDLHARIGSEGDPRSLEVDASLFGARLDELDEELAKLAVLPADQRAVLSEQIEQQREAVSDAYRSIEDIPLELAPTLSPLDAATDPAPAAVEIDLSTRL